MVSISKTGISGQMLNAVRSPYYSVNYCVRFNSFYTEWFCVSGGLMQGYTLFPLFFNLYLDDLVKYMKALDVGITYAMRKYVSCYMLMTLYY